MPYVDLIFPEDMTGFVMPMMDVSKITRKWLDVSYTPSKPHPDRKLDIYLPETGDGPFPTLICIHGGAFWGGDKRDMQIGSYMEFIPQGYAVVSVEQRLCRLQADGSYSREGEFPNPVHDYKASIRFLRENAAQYNLNPDKFVLCGGSAGGYHVVIAAASASNEILYDNSLGYADVSGEVSGVVSWFPVGDLMLQSQFSADNPFMELPDGTKMPLDNMADIFLGIDSRKHPNLAHFAAPEAWVTKDMPPTLLQHGAADALVPAECSRGIYAKIRDVCGDDRVIYDEFPQHTHGDPRFGSEENLAYIAEWLKKILA